jgi:hypothetical protein
VESALSARVGQREALRSALAALAADAGAEAADTEERVALGRHLEIALGVAAIVEAALRALKE